MSLFPKKIQGLLALSEVDKGPEALRTVLLSELLWLSMLPWATAREALSSVGLEDPDGQLTALFEAGVKIGTLLDSEEMAPVAQRLLESIVPGSLKLIQFWLMAGRRFGTYGATWVMPGKSWVQKTAPPPGPPEPDFGQGIDERKIYAVYRQRTDTAFQTILRFTGLLMGASVWSTALSLTDRELDAWSKEGAFIWKLRVTGSGTLDAYTQGVSGNRSTVVNGPFLGIIEEQRDGHSFTTESPWETHSPGTDNLVGEAVSTELPVTIQIAVWF